jgi:hypothetical protein
VAVTRLNNVMVLGWVTCAGWLAPARGQALLDQQFEPPTAPANLGANLNDGSKFVGQTFTARQTGSLTRVATYFHRNRLAQTDFEFTIRATWQGLPTGVPLATEVFPFSAVPTGATTGFTTFDVLFDPAPHIEAGQQYAIVVQSPLVSPGAGNDTGNWSGSTTQPGYPLGSLVSSGDGVLWTDDRYDLFFRTYVTVPEPPAIIPFVPGYALLRRRRSCLTPP